MGNAKAILIVIFNLNLYHRSVTKKKKGIHVFLDCEDYVRVTYHAKHRF